MELKEWKEDIAWIVITIILVLALHTALKFALHTNSPLVIVVSGSMEPVFYRGDVILLEGVSPQDIKVGDVVVYKRPYTRYPIIHRVRGIEKINVDGKQKLCFVIQGDNNPVPDPGLVGSPYLDCIPGDVIEAKALLVFPKIGLIPLEVREKLSLG